ncbi:hypothetical protein BI084_gp68 [Gordonia phage Terapin]|uniref:Uncharacterized protein n=5 Tax=Terapinvirus terapin TaxID=2734283 RepID=A0A345MBA7_9CAUD|nr:hypothetical protein BI084_gp68 [Gordonia phage Terapin]AVP43344.1 hypothetical protein PBI_DJOKOVIC_67 [Gordonia phage Djokovic]AXH67778.1 hypothetical protein SEA_BEYONCAGE_67 [Gordonia phage Beyoncage]QOC56212.1 hypothetical protein SEA_SIENNA_67 [Gordonia phage Sienna]QOC56637.1 hypothetical protein SEA_BITESIZE_67 [Gordonia phage BiteSize]QYW00869.1 hypothetical protein SEA_MADI_66 [Gordonia phage Madi]
MRGYWAERERQEIALENELYKESDGNSRPALLSFQEYLMGSRRNGR